MTVYNYATIFHATNLTTYRLTSVGQEQIVIGVAGQHADRLANRLRDTIQSTPSDLFAVTQIGELCQRFIQHFQQAYLKKHQSRFEGNVLEGIGILWLTNQAVGRGYQWGKCQLTTVSSTSSYPLIQDSGQIQTFSITPNSRLIIDIHHTDVTSFVITLPEQAFTAKSSNEQALLASYPYSFSATFVQSQTQEIPVVSVDAIPSTSAGTQFDQPVERQDSFEADSNTHEFLPALISFISPRQVVYISGLIGLMVVGWLAWLQQRDQPLRNPTDQPSLEQPLTSSAAETKPEKVAALTTSMTTASAIQSSAPRQDNIALAEEQAAKLSLSRADDALNRADVYIQNGQNIKARMALDSANKNYRIYFHLKPNQAKKLRFRINKLNQLRLVVTAEESSF